MIGRHARLCGAKLILAAGVMSGQCPTWSARFDQLQREAPDPSFSDSVNQLRAQGLVASMASGGGPQKALEAGKMQSAEYAKSIAELRQTIQSGSYFPQHVSVLKAAEWGKNMQDEFNRLAACHAAQGADPFAGPAGGMRPGMGQSQAQAEAAERARQFAAGRVDRLAASNIEEAQKRTQGLLNAGIQYRAAGAAGVERMEQDLAKATTVRPAGAGGGDAFAAAGGGPNRNLALTTRRATMRPGGAAGIEQEVSGGQPGRPERAPAPRGGQSERVPEQAGVTPAAAPDAVLAAARGGQSEPVPAQAGVPSAAAPEVEIADTQRGRAERAPEASIAAAQTRNIDRTEAPCATVEHLGPALLTDRVKGSLQHLLLVQEDRMRDRDRVLEIDFVWTRIEAGQVIEIRADRVRATILKDEDKGIGVVGFVLDPDRPQVASSLRIRGVRCEAK